jgi:formylglycine-generating enzyme
MITLIGTGNGLITCAAMLDFPMEYLAAREEIERFSKQNDFLVNDMPMAINAMAGSGRIRNLARSRYLDVLTAEYQGMRDGKRYYEAWHSVGALSTPEGLRLALKTLEGNGFSPVDEAEWIAMGDGWYKGEKIPRINCVDDLRQGVDIPNPGKPYICSLMLPSDFHLIPLDADKDTVLEYYRKDGLVIFESGQLNSWQFELDDRVLCLCGSPDNRKSLAAIVFADKSAGGEGWSTFGSHHNLEFVQDDVCPRPMGRPVFFYNDNTGICGRIYGYGNFLATSRRFDAAREGMIKVTGGCFDMGSPEDEVYTGDYQAAEHPQHRVYVDGFFMDITTITQKHYREIMGIKASNSIGDDLPVVDVTWYDAIRFCNARSRKDGLEPVYSYTEIFGPVIKNCEYLENFFVDYEKNGYRLPTEAEWEYACRSGSKTRFFWGSEMDGDFAWSEINTDPVIRPVGLKKPNAWGLYDMAGNIQEWCGDWFSADYYASSPEYNPKGPESGRLHVLRGGSNYPYKDRDRLRSANRSCNKPDAHGGFYGFRTIVPEKPPKPNP